MARSPRKSLSRPPRFSLLANSPYRQSFRFTPQATRTRAPRLWDRKPLPPANPFSKKREVWKRVLFPNSGANNKTGRKFGEEKEDMTAERGVKRLRVGRRDAEEREVFVETKWVEVDWSRSRKIAGLNLPRDNTEQDESHGNPDVETGGVLLTTSDDYGAALPDILTVNGIVTESIRDDNGDGLLPVTVRRSPGLQTEFLVSTTESLETNNPSLLSGPLRFSNLDSDLAEVLGDFLSSARARRAARTAAPGFENSENTSAGSPEKDTPQTPRSSSRRALKVLDKNSPSPARGTAPAPRPKKSPRTARPKSPKMTQPSKPEAEASSQDKSLRPEPEIPEKAEVEAETSIEDDEVPPAPCENGSPTRPNAPKVKTINLRRPKGTEFIFTQKSEAHQLTLTTRKNTRKNRGTAVMPQIMLRTLREQALEEEQGSNPDADKETSGSDAASEQRPDVGKRKRVKWNDENLVSYCENKGAELLTLEEVGLDTPSRGTRKRKAEVFDKDVDNDNEETVEKDDAPAPPPLPLLSPSVPRKVRRLGPTKNPGLLQRQNAAALRLISIDEFGKAVDAEAEKEEKKNKKKTTSLPKLQLQPKTASGTLLLRGPADTPMPKRKRTAMIPKPVVPTATVKKTVAATATTAASAMTTTAKLGVSLAGSAAKRKGLSAAAVPPKRVKI